MKRYIYRSETDIRLRIISVILCTALNVLPTYFSHRSGFPLYLDTFGTMAASMTGGAFSGILTAVISNLASSFFYRDAVYFGIINVLIAIHTAWGVKRGAFRSAGGIAFFILSSGMISGVLGAFIQLQIQGGTPNESFSTLMNSLENRLDLPIPLMYFVLNLLLNIFDKGLSCAVSGLIVKLLPKTIRTRLGNSNWQQRPLTREEIDKLSSINKGIRGSLNKRMALVLMINSLILITIMGSIGISLFFQNYKQEKTEIATEAASFAADIVDPEKIDGFIRSGENFDGYRETEDMLSRIRSNAAGVRELYVFQIKNGGCCYVFDVSADDSRKSENGSQTDLPKELEPYRSELLAGSKIGPVERSDIFGWCLSVYYPISDSHGICRGYVGTDISLSYTADYMRTFIMRVLLIMSGFLTVVLVYAISITRQYAVFPINSIVLGVEQFIAAGTDQEKLDESVRNLRSFDIHTGDETEKLYHAICDMAANQTEQLRSLRRFAENTARMQDGLIVTMADLVENRDSDTGAHVQKTSAYVKIIVEGLKRKGYYAEKLSPKFMSDVVRSAPLHDVGKINIPDVVLNKPGKLTEEEYEIIKTHTTAGRKIMEKAISTVEGENYLKEARNMAAYHHERWDGKGYPEGLHGEVIPLAARIMAVADVFDALASPRVYKPAFPLDKALSIIQEGAGTQFDPKCVEVFMESLPEVKAVLQKYNQDQEGVNE